MTVGLDELLAEMDTLARWDDYVAVVRCPMCQTGNPFPPDRLCPVCQGHGKIQYSLEDVDIVYTGADRQ